MKLKSKKLIFSVNITTHNDLLFDDEFKELFTVATFWLTIADAAPTRVV